MPKDLKVGDRVAYVDEDVYELAKWLVWWPSIEGTNVYAKSSLPRSIGGGGQVRLHHLVMYWACGHRQQAGRVIDHIDNNGLNNVRSNLRFVRPHENLANRRAVRGESKFKGVHRSSAKGKWTANVRFEGKTHRLGAFDTQEAAARAYDEAAVRIQGQYAKTNAELGLYEETT